MNPVENVHSLEKITAHYLQELEAFSMEQLHKKPSEDEVNMPGAEKRENGQAILAQGSLPPIRIHVPASPEYTPAQPASKEQLVKGMQAVLERMHALAPTVDDIPAHHKVEHPGFGPLAAKEWFALVEMHYRHHLHQLNRLKG